MVRLNLRVIHNDDKFSKVTIMGNGLGYSSTIFTNFDSICSHNDFPSMLKSYYRPQLARNPLVDDSFLTTSFDDSFNPHFNKINEYRDAVLEKNVQTLNTVHVINNVKRHSSITFASVFNQNDSDRYGPKTCQISTHLVEPRF